MYTMIDGEPVNLGHAFGYCFVPEVSTKKGPALALSPAGDGEAWDLHPRFGTQEEALSWLRERSLAGHVLRYAHHKPVEERDEGYRPWVTAGIVAKAEGSFLDDVCPKYAEAAAWSEAYGQRLQQMVREREGIDAQDRSI